MRKLFPILTCVLSLFFMSCASNSINAADFEEPVFQVTKIVLTNYERLFNYDEIKQFLSEFDYDKYKDSFEESTNGLILDCSLLTKENIEANLKEAYIETNGEKYSLGIWTGEFESDNANGKTATITININALDIRFPFTVSIEAEYLQEGASKPKTTKMNYSNSSWALKKTKADENNCARIKFGKNFIPYMIQKESYDSYLENNKKDNYILVDAGTNVLIGTIVKDPGIPLILDASTWNARKIFTFEKGKTYTINYEIDRNHFLKADWTIELKAVEE